MIIAGGEVSILKAGGQNKPGAPGGMISSEGPLTTWLVRLREQEIRLSANNLATVWQALSINAAVCTGGQAIGCDNSAQLKPHFSI